MALWARPRRARRCAQRPCWPRWAMREALRRRAAALGPPSGQAAAIGIAINTGEAWWASSVREPAHYTAIGDAREHRRAPRGLHRPGKIFITRSTFEEVGNMIESSAAVVRVQGKAELLEMFEVTQIYPDRRPDARPRGVPPPSRRSHRAAPRPPDPWGRSGRDVTVVPGARAPDEEPRTHGVPTAKPPVAAQTDRSGAARSRPQRPGHAPPTAAPRHRSRADDGRRRRRAAGEARRREPSAPPPAQRRRAARRERPGRAHRRGPGHRTAAAGQGAPPERLRPRRREQRRRARRPVATRQPRGDAEPRGRRVGFGRAVPTPAATPRSTGRRDRQPPAPRCARPRAARPRRSASGADLPRPHPQAGRFRLLNRGFRRSA